MISFTAFLRTLSYPLSTPLVSGPQFEILSSKGSTRCRRFLSFCPRRSSLRLSHIYIYLSVTDIRSDSVLPRKAHTRAANETQLTPAARISYAVYSSTGTRGRFSEQLRTQSSRKHCRRKPALREVRQNPRCTA